MNSSFVQLCLWGLHVLFMQWQKKTSNLFASLSRVSAEYNADIDSLTLEITLMDGSDITVTTKQSYCGDFGPRTLQNQGTHRTFILPRKVGFGGWILELRFVAHKPATWPNYITYTVTLRSALSSVIHATRNQRQIRSSKSVFCVTATLNWDFLKLPSWAVEDIPTTLSLGSIQQSKNFILPRNRNSGICLTDLTQR